MKKTIGITALAMAAALLLSSCTQATTNNVDVKTAADQGIPTEAWKIVDLFMPESMTIDYQVFNTPQALAENSSDVFSAEIIGFKAGRHFDGTGAEEGKQRPSVLIELGNIEAVKGTVNLGETNHYFIQLYPAIVKTKLAEFEASDLVGRKVVAYLRGVSTAFADGIETSETNNIFEMTNPASFSIDAGDGYFVWPIIRNAKKAAIADLLPTGKIVGD